MVFGSYPLVDAVGNATQTQAELSRLMRGVWTGLAKGSMPQWPRLGTNAGLELMNFGVDGSSTAVLQPLLTVDYSCPLFYEFDVVNFRSY